MEPEKKTRRNFLSQILVGWITMLILPGLYIVGKYVIPPKIREQLFQALKVANVSELPLGTAKIVKSNKKAIALVRTDQGQIKAFSAVCTHLGCIVQYQSDRALFHCNCHGSEFDLTGKNLSGPAPVPLQPYRVDIKGDDVLITQA